jgi:hypothetical protein
VQIPGSVPAACLIVPQRTGRGYSTAPRKGKTDSGTAPLIGIEVLVLANAFQLTALPARGVQITPELHVKHIQMIGGVWGRVSARELFSGAAVCASNLNPLAGNFLNFGPNVRAYFAAVPSKILLVKN